MSDGRNVHMAMYHGGGNITQLRPIAARLVAQGYRVRIIVGPGLNRARIPVDKPSLQKLSATGAKLTQLREPEVHLWAARCHQIMA